MKIFTMYLIFLLIVLNKIVDAEEDSNESKYIDLLPEKEKEDFLQRIARRILADVKTKDDHDKYDGEVSEDELNTHHEFVQKIFKEESDNFRRIDGKEKNKDAIIEKNENPDDYLKVKSLETNKQSDLNRDDDDKYLDLTLRHGKRDKRNGKSKEISVEVQVDKENTVEDNSTKHEDIIEDQEKIKEMKVEEPLKISSIEPKNVEESDSEDIQIKLSRRSSSDDTNYDTNSSQIITVSPSEPNMTLSHNSDAASPDNSNNDNKMLQKESIFNDISTTPSSENDSITINNVKEETTFQEDDTTTDYYKSDEKHNLSDNTLKIMTTTENNSRKNLNNNVTDKVKSFIERAVNITFFDEILVEKKNNKSAVANLNQVNTKDEIEKSTIENVDNFFENITTTENYSSYNMTDEVNSVIERDAVNVTSVDDNVGEEVNNNSTVADRKKDTEDKIEDTTTDNFDNFFENITTTENNSSNNMTDEVKSVIERDAINITSVDNNVVEEVNKIAVAELKQDNTKDEIEETTIGNVDKVFENKNTTENNSREKLYNNETDEVKRIIKRANVIITSIDDNVVKELNNKSTAADLKQDTTDAIEETTIDNVDIQNLTKPAAYPIVGTTHSNIDTVLNETVDAHTITEITPLQNKIAMSIDDVNNNGSIRNDSDKLVATTVKYNTDQTDTEIYSRQSIHLDNDDTQNSKENISSTTTVHAIEKKHNKENYLREYNVFEVPRGEPPFVQKEAPTNQEQPYYVPVYNYEPNNAYFNAHNRLGPNYDSDNKGRLIEKPVNAVEKDDAKFESDYFFDSKEKTHRKFRFRVSTKKPWHSKKPTYTDNFVVSKPKYVDIYFNPDDYLDVDYYFSKMKRVSSKKTPPSFPSSSDEGHPYHSIANEDLKDHIRAIRNILWKQNHFGYISPSPPLGGSSEGKGKKKNENEATEKPETSEETVVAGDPEIHQEGFRNYYRSKVDKDQPAITKMDANKNIAIDYYFGRMPNENVKKVGYIKQDDIHKDVFLKAEEIPSDNILNDIKVIKFNDKQYVNNDVISDTPHTFLLTDSNQENEDILLQKPVKRYSIYPAQRPKDPQKPKIHKGDIDTIAKVAKLATMQDVFVHIQSMLAINLPVTRKNNGDIDAYVKALNDMVQTDDLALKRYDWLGTTVDIRAAFMKLMDMTEAWQDRAILDPADIELLNYTLFLHKSAKELILKEETEKMNALRKQALLPRNKNKKKRLIKEKGLFQRVWLLRKEKNSDITELKALLNDFQYYLYDLHEAIRNIAPVTKFRNQKWYESLKKIYFTPDKRKLLEVILHLSTTRFLGLIEDSAQNGLEDDFIDYILHHKKEVKKTVEEFMFVLKLLHELKRF